MSAAAAIRPAHPADPSQPAPRSAHFPLFDSLRAIAALSVLLYHVRDYSGVSATVQRYTGHLDMGVTVFFVISGFLLYRPFVHARLRGKPPLATGPYAWRRFLRIVPAYWVALIAAGLLLGNYTVFGTHSPYYFGLLQTFRSDTMFGGISQAWTLSVELSFYVFLPLWAWAIHRVPARTAGGRLDVEIVGIGVLLAIGLLYQELYLFGPHGSERHGVPWLALPHFIDQFAIGMGLAVASVWLEGRPLPPAVRVVARYPSLPWIAAGVAFWVACTQIGLHGVAWEYQSQGQALDLHYLASIVGLGLVLPAVFGHPRVGGVRRLLGYAPLLWVGLVSYAVYIWHPTVLRKLFDWRWPQDVIHATGLPPYLVWAVLTLTIVLVVAALSYYGIERRALSLKRFRIGEWPRGNRAAERLGRRLAALGAVALLGAAALDFSHAARYSFVVVAFVVLGVLGFAPRVAEWREPTAALIVGPGVALLGVSVIRLLSAPATAGASGNVGALWLAFLASLGIAGGGWLLWRSWQPIAAGGVRRRAVRQVSDA